jgi:hypothetical protein
MQTSVSGTKQPEATFAVLDACILHAEGMREIHVGDAFEANAARLDVSGALLASSNSSCMIISYIRLNR